MRNGRTEAVLGRIDDVLDSADDDLDVSDDAMRWTPPGRPTPARTTKPERRQRKTEWLQWRRLGRLAASLGHSVEPGPECTLGEFCRWYRAEAPTIRVRARLTVK